VKIVVKETFGLVLIIAICLLALCATFYWPQEFPLYLKDAVTALVTAMIGGVAVSPYLGVIGSNNSEEIKMEHPGRTR
jgi:hypothetical protein